MYILLKYNKNVTKYAIYFQILQVDVLLNFEMKADIQTLRKTLGTTFGERVSVVQENGFSLEQAVIYVACHYDASFFINHFCMIYDTVGIPKWIPFKLWDAQRRVLAGILTHNKFIALKTRQIGITWLILAYILWLALFRAPQSITIMSKGQKESIYLLSHERLRGMYNRLPTWMKADSVLVDDKLTFTFTRGENTSTIRGASTKTGDGYVDTLAFIDEADLIPDLDAVLSSIEPTVNAGGQLILVSKSNRKKPNSLFKRIFRNAYNGLLKAWGSAFVAWFEHPDRTQSWYDKMCFDRMEIDGNLDHIYENYPATVKEALSVSQFDKRIPAHHLEQCYSEKQPISVEGELAIYEPYRPTNKYVIGVDCAEGLATSDYSTAIVVDILTGTEVAVLRGRIAPDTQAEIVKRLSVRYGNAGVLVERNNHGHAFIAVASRLGMNLLLGLDRRIGWQTNHVSKALLYTDICAVLRDRIARIHNLETYTELQQIQKSDLSAPDGTDYYDDLAVAFVLAHKARSAYGGGVETNLDKLLDGSW